MKSKWIWYYGDFEIYHSLKMQLRREEYDYHFAPFWRMDSCWHNVLFRRNIVLGKQETVIVHAYGSGRVEIDGKRYPFKREIVLDAGEHTIVVYVANVEGVPCIYVEGNALITDESWTVSNYGEEWVHAGCNDYYVSPEDNPQIFKFSYEEIIPVKIEKVNKGVLYDYGRETFAKLIFEQVGVPIRIGYGESREEALDYENSYLWGLVDRPGELSPKAFRYLFIIGDDKDNYCFRTMYEYLPLEYRGSLSCSDELINQIWNMSAYTFHLNSREFFLDGIKRDRWVWSGDAFQSYLINRYLFFDKDLCKRTIIALRGKDPIEQHINIIPDYSFYWLISIYEYYVMTGDGDFVERIYPRMESLMEFCLSRLDGNGFVSKVGDDWIFIDWAEMDKQGAVCAEQMLLLKSLESLAQCAEICRRDGTCYRKWARELKERINQYYWNDEKGAYVDCFESGKNNVTRHANIFALLFQCADDRQKGLIIERVLLNDEITQIKTPYFKFYELEALCIIGKFDEVLKRIREYWGSMIERGATTIWEEYNPEVSGVEQYAMYGDKYGKSLCHAWGASPIYLLGRYFLGVSSTAVGYTNFEVKPHLDGFAKIEAVVPINDGAVTIKKDKDILEVTASRDGGVLVFNSAEYVLKKNETVRVDFTIVAN